MFNVRGPGDAGWVRPNALGLSRVAGSYPRAGIYRVKLVMGPTGLPKIRCADVLGTPPVVWPPSCLLLDTDENGQSYVSSLSFAYIFKIAPDCDHDGFNDQVVQPNIALCPRTCRVDVNDDGSVSVADIFSFLTAWFSDCTGQPGPPCNGFSADWNGVNGLSVQDIFDYLAAWFASGGLNCS